MGAQTTPWELHRESLLAPEVAGEVPELGASVFACDVIREVIAQARARSPQDPAPPPSAMMMMALLAHAYSQGIFSSREISRSCELRLDFLSITGGTVPDFRALLAFRDKFVEPLRVVIGQFIEVARKSGLPIADRGGSSMDEAARWLTVAKRRDQEQQAKLGARSGLEQPAWILDPAARRARIRDALGIKPPAPKVDAARSRSPSRVTIEPPSDDPRKPKVRAHSRETTEIIRAVSDEDLVGMERPSLDMDATEARGIPVAPKREAAADRPTPAPPRAAPARGGSVPSPASSGAASAVEIIRRVRSPEDRVRLVEVAIGAALIDAELTSLEKRRIEQLVRFLRLDAADKEHLIGIMRSRRLPEIPLADEIPDYDVRLCMFEHAALMVVADGRPNSAEQEYLREVAESLEIDFEDVKVIITSASQQIPA